MTLPDSGGRFGEYGGRFAPETLMDTLTELEKAFLEAWADRTRTVTLPPSGVYRRPFSTRLDTI